MRPVTYSATPRWCHCPERVPRSFEGGYSFQSSCVSVGTLTDWSGMLSAAASSFLTARYPAIATEAGGRYKYRPCLPGGSRATGLIA